MLDIRPNQVFMAYAFEPHLDDVKTAIRRDKRPPIKTVTKKVEVLKLSDGESSSDEEMPDVRELMKTVHTPKDKGKGKAKAVEEAGDMDVVGSVRYFAIMALTATPGPAGST